MHEFDSEDFAEFKKMYSTYQHAQENSIDNEGNNAIEANATQQYTTPSNDNEEPDLFNVLQAKHQSNAGFDFTLVQTKCIALMLLM